MIKRHRDREHRNRRRRRKAAQLPFARPIAAAYADARTSREETALEIKQTLALVAALPLRPDTGRPTEISSPVPDGIAPSQIVKPDPTPIEPIVITSPRLPEIVPLPVAPQVVRPTEPPVVRAEGPVPPVSRGEPDGTSAAQSGVTPICAEMPEPRLATDVAVPITPSAVATAPAVPATVSREGWMHRWWQALFWPVVLAAAIIAASNWFAPSIRPGAHLVPAPVASAPAVLEALTASETGVRTAAVPDSAGGEQVAVLATPESIPATDVLDGTVAARDVDFLPRTRACTTGEIASAASAAVATAPDAFGVTLATAAEAQIRDFVIYNDEYFNLRYPGGDIPAFYGVCSDVVIRAYRALGIDLQKAVHEARVGSGDSSIDHRRTETLRRFFARHALRLPVTDYAEDYLAGDIVTYERPQNHGAQAHIAVVATEIGPSGRPMIVHNRGWGPQIEDALFVDRITGHYRLSGAPRLLTSWTKTNAVGRGMESWSTLVRRAAIQRGATPNPKDPAKKKAGQTGAASPN